MDRNYDASLVDQYIVFDKNDLEKYVPAQSYALIKDIRKSISKKRLENDEEIIHYLVCDSNIRYADKITKYIKQGSRFYDENKKVMERYRLYDRMNPYLSEEELENNWVSLYDMADKFLKKYGVNARVDRSLKLIRKYGDYKGPYCIVRIVLSADNKNQRALKHMCVDYAEVQFLRVYDEYDKQKEEKVIYAEYRIHMHNMIAKAMKQPKEAEKDDGIKGRDDI